MKKIIAVILLSISSIALAGGPGHHNHHGYWRHDNGRNWVWVVPTVIGGVIGYEIARNQQQPVVVQQPVVIQQPVIVQSQYCSPWTEIVNTDGTITRTRTCTQ
jgi:hypothetical protein